jgi:hypothetical protein
MRWFADRPPDHVHCYSCGLLAHLDPRLEITDVPLLAREDPVVLWDDGIPHCAVGRLAPNAEFQDALKATADARASAIATIKKTRTCSDWTPYLVGLSLQDHLRERQVHRLEQERREWERVTQELATSSQRKVDRAFLRLGLLQVLIGVISIGITLLAAWLFSSNITVIIH